MREFPESVGRGLVPWHHPRRGTSPSPAWVTQRRLQSAVHIKTALTPTWVWYRRATLILAMVALLLALLVAPVARADPQVDDIAGQLACQCGCGLTALACGGAMQCDVGDQMVALIGSKVKKGETKEEILSYFVAQYGEKVLAAPTKQGFNLTAWITPFLAVAAGGSVVYFVLRDWLANRRVREEAEAEAPADLAPYGERIDRELEQFG